MKENKGYFLIHRKIAQHRFWLSEKFTKAQAWIDLILLANHEQSTTYVRGIEVKMETGQLFWSEFSLSERWGWSRGKTRNFLENLQNHGEISRKLDNKIGLITVLNYSKYQKKEQQTVQQTVQQKANKMYPNNTLNTLKEDIYSEIIFHYNEVTGKKIKTIDEKAVDFWTKYFSLKEIKTAISNLPLMDKEEKEGGFWKNMTIVRFFRTRNTNGKPDTIEQALNYQPKSKTLSFNSMEI